MKKLMIAAAFTAAMVGTVSAACADPTPVCGDKCTWGYKLMLVAKTTMGGNVSNAYAKVCDSCFRKPTMGKLYGYLFGVGEAGDGTCGDAGCKCVDLKTATDVKLLLWKAWNKAPVLTEAPKFDVYNRIGYKDRSTVEMCWDIAFTDFGSSAKSEPVLTLAGFGKAAHRADGSIALKSANGYFAGQMLAYCSECEKGCGPEVCVDTVAQYWTMCDDTTPVAAEDADACTAAYGKWQMIWDGQLVDRLTKKGISASTAKPSAAYPDHPQMAIE